MSGPVPPDWPQAEHSRILDVSPHRWHVQRMGAGPEALLLHGAGGGTQSWRHLVPVLAPHLHLTAVDLPGQGFTRAGGLRRLGLDQMAEDLKRLMKDQGWQPRVLIGHSAGAAIALRLAEMLPEPPRVIGINAAIANFAGVAGVLFPVMAKALAAMPFVADLFVASTARRGSLERLIAGTGSRLPPEDLRFYGRLISDRAHVDGTLSMMAQWSLGPLLERLPDLQAPTLFVTGSNDRAVPPATSAKHARRMPDARHIDLPGFGHLLHEEAPERVAELILEELTGAGVL